MNNTDLQEGSPPYLHTRYLSEAEQMHCLVNPTYSARLATARALRQDVQYAQIALDVAKRTRGTQRRQVEDQEHRLHELEGRFTTQDNLLGALAEALIRCSGIWQTQEVLLIDGRWMWPLPDPERLARVDRMAALPERMVPPHDAVDTTFARQQGPTPARKLSLRLSSGLSRFIPGRKNSNTKRLSKIQLMEHF
ncbi:hypothetical protein LTS10_007818 [Elasticomyces elasticus]|nr:hypothetical protein LTS10_007818 [Elasticomyces elasticus]